MRIQDKIRGQKLAKRKDSSDGFAQRGLKVQDELPVPHHSGWVDAPADQDPMTDHQKVTG